MQMNNNKVNDDPNLGEFLVRQAGHNPFEPRIINIISTSELLISLVHLCEESIIPLATKITPDYYYFESTLRIPKLYRTNVIQIPNLFTTSKLKVLTFVTKQLLLGKNVTSKDRHSFETILFGRLLLSE